MYGFILRKKDSWVNIASLGHFNLVHATLLSSVAILCLRLIFYLSMQSILNVTHVALQSSIMKITLYLEHVVDINPELSVHVHFVHINDKTIWYYTHYSAIQLFIIMFKLESDTLKELCTRIENLIVVVPMYKIRLV